MTASRRAASLLLALAATLLLIAMPAAAAEEQAPPAPLPFDPLAIELVLPHDTVDNAWWNVDYLATQKKPIGSLTYSWAGKTKTVDQYLGESGSDGFVVLDDGKIAYERYFDINNAATLHQSWSMMKSFVSTLIGIAIKEGKIASIDDPVDKYVPALAANGYRGVRIRDVLHMSSGVKWNETYLDFANGDVNWLIADPVINNLTFGLAGNTLKSFVTQTKFTRAVTPGEHFAYSSMDSEILGMVVKGATGVSPSRYLQDKIWRPAGMGSSAWLLKDREGTNFTFAGLYATARDYARFGELFRNNGKRDNTQVVPASWVHDATTASEPWLEGTGGPVGYGYQWWLDNAAPGNFLAQGFEGQHIYVSPASKTTIVKLSDDLGISGPSRAWESLTVYRTIADYAATH
jgi:CubicO group peptidase (beta-lactamase class C family)